MSAHLARLSLLLSVLTPSLALAQQVRPNVVFEERCATCHGNVANARGPEPGTLRRMTPDRIYTALTSGLMSAQGADLNDAEKRAIAEYLSERRLVDVTAAAASAMPNRCSVMRPLDVSTASWNGWGVDLANSRFQPMPAAALTPGQVPQLKLKWAFGFPGAVASYGQPTPVGDRLFVGVDTGYVYALNTATGCVHWSFQALAGVRTAVSVGPVPGREGRFAAYFGDMRANVYAVDADTGEQLWTVRVDDHPLARITGTPKLHGGRLYVPVSSFEEGSAGTLSYQCCTFRGSLVALDIATGRQVWKTYTIADAARPTRKNSKGTQLWGPAGGAIWSSPTIDERRGLIYVASGNSYTAPAARTTDAVIAFEMATGKIAWSAQATESDAWIAGCGPTPALQSAQPPGTPGAARSENCPDDLGPDYDFATAPLLVSLRGGRQILVTAQKSGMVAARDPAERGALLWQTSTATRPVGPTGEIVWGGATDGVRAYYGLNSSAAVAVQLSTGAQQWRTQFTPADVDHPGNNSAVSLVPGVLFSGGWDGIVRALSADTGAVLWEFNTAREFPTVNGVTAKGGSIGGPGPTIARGMVFVSSGYVGVQRGLPGNVLLAFGVE
jgi:polyvinyl alcohol dehydrogenase (cytochrome)